MFRETETVFPSCWKLKVIVNMDAKPQSKRIALDIREWQQTFQELICQEKPRARWTLKMDGNLQPDCVAQGWRQYQQKGFGRYVSLSSCGPFWAKRLSLALMNSFKSLLKRICVTRLFILLQLRCSLVWK